MSMNPHWTRWIHASLSKHFKDHAQHHSYVLHIEGQDRVVLGNADWVEMRWDGPYADENSKNYWDLDVEINLLINSVLGRDDTHKHKRMVGLAQSTFITAIPVYKYGEILDVDTNELLGCLQLRSGDRQAIVTSYFGKIEADVVLEQSTVEAHYRMTLTTGSY